MNGEALYRLESLVGTGSFGQVYYGVDRSTGRTVAIKKVLQDKRYKNRELQIMQMISHPNVVRLLDSYVTGEEYLNIVMEYVPDTLYRLLKEQQKLKQKLPTALLQVYLYQMMKAFAFLHSLSIVCRDCKPANILIDPLTHRLVICDMGSAKVIMNNEQSVAYICSRFYRAPELIMNTKEYGPEIDMWSVGTVFAEMINLQPLFRGDSNLDQLAQIMEILGSPTREQIMAMNPEFIDMRFPAMRKSSKALHKILRTDSSQAANLLVDLLEYHPRKRLTAQQALSHPFFYDLKQIQVLPGNKPLPENLFTF